MAREARRSSSMSTARVPRAHGSFMSRSSRMYHRQACRCRRTGTYNKSRGACQTGPAVGRALFLGRMVAGCLRRRQVIVPVVIEIVAGVAVAVPRLLLDVDLAQDHARDLGAALLQNFDCRLRR